MSDLIEGYLRKRVDGTRSRVPAALDREGLKFRAPGAVALSLAYARSARYFLFVGAFRVYDFAAGLALCRGMEMIVEEEYVIVARDRETLERIERILRDNSNRG